MRNTATTQQNDQHERFTASLHYRQSSDKRGAYEATYERETANYEAVEYYTRQFMEVKR